MRQSMYKPAGKACNINSTITVSEFMDHPVHVISYQREGSEEESYQYIRNFIYTFLLLVYPTLIFLI